MTPGKLSRTAWIILWTVCVWMVLVPVSRWKTQPAQTEIHVGSEPSRILFMDSMTGRVERIHIANASQDGNITSKILEVSLTNDTGRSFTRPAWPTAEFETGDQTRISRYLVSEGGRGNIVHIANKIP